MKRIRILNDDVINKIAAGEVLDRPSSAVKELVENSIDANSKKIDIFIRDGGKTEILVIDDGEGILKNDLKLAVQRHATSKINSEKFDTISSLGFRGEALPSIGAVSEMSIKSNIQNNQEGFMIEVKSGILERIKPVNHSKGTTVQIKNLFFSTPARLKFLKSENYESLLIKRIIQKLALCNYKIEFRLSINNKEIINISVKKSDDEEKLFENRIKELLGEEFFNNCIYLNQRSENIKIKGFLGIPTFHHSNTNNQFVFINGRIIQDKSLNVIFKLAYRDFMSYDRFPQLVIFIECPKNEVDINVHPTKNEVRFQNLNFLRSQIFRIFKEAIASAGHKASTINTIHAIDRFSHSNDQNKLNLKEEKLPSRYSEFPDINYKENNDIDEKQQSNNETLPLGYAKSQFHKTYIISETSSGVVIIDQHAAHERLVYEKLKKNFYDKKIETQILLIPVVIDLDFQTLKSLENCFKIADQYGVKIEKFGKNSIIVREVPYILSNCNIKKLVLDLLDELIEIKESTSIESKINLICSSMACHGSIRAGRELQVDEMNDLLRRMEATPFSGQCNHGRPTYVELKLSDIEKLFGRK